MLTLELLRNALDTKFGGYLKSGTHQEGCEVCVRELRAIALNLPWSDHPDGDSPSATDLACQRLNDSCWSSDEVRTKWCLPLALLSERTAKPRWVKDYILRTIRTNTANAFRHAAKVHPEQKHKAALEAEAVKLSEVKDLSDVMSAARAAWSAAMSAAESAALSAASAAWSAAMSAARAAWSAAMSAAETAAMSAASAAKIAADQELIIAVGNLIEAQGNEEALAAHRMNFGFEKEVP
jgi:hypothetical protein